MVPLSSLGVPILVSAVIVFLASALLHMVLPWHSKDFSKMSNEDDVLEALRRANVAPGDYLAPRPDTHAAMKDPKFLERQKRGPIVIMTLSSGSDVSMGKPLAMWFLFCVVVNLFAGYIASRALAPGVHYLEVFRFVGTAAFMGYSLGYIPNSIWYRRRWSTTMKVVIDGLLFALLTAGTFGWLWPK
jgi:hypothetical protein